MEHKFWPFADQHGHAVCLPSQYMHNYLFRYIFLQSFCRWMLENYGSDSWHWWRKTQPQQITWQSHALPSSTPPCQAMHLSSEKHDTFFNTFMASANFQKERTLSFPELFCLASQKMTFCLMESRFNLHGNNSLMNGKWYNKEMKWPKHNIDSVTMETNVVRWPCFEAR